MRLMTTPGYPVWLMSRLLGGCCCRQHGMRACRKVQLQCSPNSKKKISPVTCPLRRM